MAPLVFRDAFWGSDFTSRDGYDALIGRLKDGRQMCRDVEELIRMRALAEERYGKELVMIAHKAQGLTEIGTLRGSFDQLKANIETIGNFHIHLSDVLREEAMKIEMFHEKQKEQRRKFSTIMEKVMKMNASCYKKTMESKNHCKQKCLEASEAEKQTEKLIAARSTTAKLIEKGYQKVQRCKRTVAETERLYLANIVQLEALRQDWVETHQSTCEVFQQLESDRISFLRCALWDHCNHFSIQCVKDDEMYEDVRTVLEKCDISADNNHFIQAKSTSSRPPEPVLFEKYSGQWDSTSGSLNSLSSPGRAAASERLSLIEGNSLDSNITLNNAPPYSESMGTSCGNSLNNLHASGVQQTGSRASFAVSETYKAVYEFRAQSADELSVVRGEVVQVTERGEDGWFMVLRDGEVGLVPGNYLIKI